jgi:hypothetical protein
MRQQYRSSRITPASRVINEPMLSPRLVAEERRLESQGRREGEKGGLGTRGTRKESKRKSKKVGKKRKK